MRHHGVRPRALTAALALLVFTAAAAAAVTVKLTAPEVKPGVVLKTRLRVRLLAAGETKPAAKHERPLWVFADDPFVNRRQWLKELKISLFDPEKTTAEPLKKLEVPF